MHTYAYVYVHIYICMCIYTHTHTHTHTYIYTYLLSYSRSNLALPSGNEDLKRERATIFSLTSPSKKRPARDLPGKDVFTFLNFQVLRMPVMSQDDCTSG